MIRYAGPNEEMVVGDEYIFQFQLPSWFTTQQLPADDLQAKRDALKSAAQVAITGQRLGVSFVDAYPVGDTIYAVTIRPARAENTSIIWNALTPALTAALNPPTGFAGVTPYTQGGSTSTTQTFFEQYKPLLIGAGILLAVMFLGRRY